jgi:hypothetical protein
MDDDPRDFHDDPGWIAVAVHFEPLTLPDPPPRPRCPHARGALASAVLGVLFLGFVFGPLALALGQRAELLLAAQPELGDARVARAAINLGKVALALHLTLLCAVIPWLLFVMPQLGSSGG